MVGSWGGVGAGPVFVFCLGGPHPSEGAGGGHSPRHQFRLPQLPERYAQLVHQIEPLLERRSFGSSNLDFQSSLTLYVRLAERRHADA